MVAALCPEKCETLEELRKFVLENPYVSSDIRQRVNNHFVRLTSKETVCDRTALKCETDKEHVSGSTIAELENGVTVEQLQNFVLLNPSAPSEIRQRVNDLFVHLTSQVETVKVKKRICCDRRSISSVTRLRLCCS